MSWLTDFVKPRIRAWVGQTDVPDNLWSKCPQCEQLIYHKDLETHMHVCPHCQHHMRVSAKQRLGWIFDDAKFDVIKLPDVSPDPLRFKDKKRYSDRYKDAVSKTHSSDALMVAKGTIGKTRCVVACFNFDFMGGSMGIAVGEGLIKASDTAIALRAPLVIMTSSGGARMQEGILSLMQMPRSVLSLENVKEQKIPVILVLCDPTTGGVSASFAMLGDVTLAESGAIIGFAGRRVIEETIREKLPSNFQRAEYLMEHGMVDQVVHRKDLRNTLKTILKLMSPKIKARA